MPKKEPLHPGKFVRYGCLEPAALSVAEGAKILGVNRQTLYDLINCRSRLSARMANRLSKAFGGAATVWLRMQVAYDLNEIPDEASDIRARQYRKTSGDTREMQT